MQELVRAALVIVLAQGGPHSMNGLEVPQELCGLDKPIAITPPGPDAKRIEGRLRVICHR
jgi:hypothetical protein